MDVQSVIWASLEANTGHGSQVKVEVQAACGSWVYGKLGRTVWVPDRDYGKIRVTGLSALDLWSLQKMLLGEAVDMEEGKYGEILTCIPASSLAQKQQLWLCLCW